MKMRGIAAAPAGGVALFAAANVTVQAAAKTEGASGESARGRCLKRRGAPLQRLRRDEQAAVGAAAEWQLPAGIVEHESGHLLALGDLHAPDRLASRAQPIGLVGLRSCRISSMRHWIEGLIFGWVRI